MTNKKTPGPVFSGLRFMVNHEHKDFYSDIQRASERIGDVGEESEKFKDAAFHQLAKEQDDYVAPDGYGTRGRENNKNYNRMEYDAVERHDGKEHDKILSDVNNLKEISVKNILDSIKHKDIFTVNTTETKIGSSPITDKTKAI